MSSSRLDVFPHSMRCPTCRHYFDAPSSRTDAGPYSGTSLTMFVYVCGCGETWEEPEHGHGPQRRVAEGIDDRPLLPI